MSGLPAFLAERPESVSSSVVSVSSGIDTPEAVRLWEGREEEEEEVMMGAGACKSAEVGFEAGVGLEVEEEVEEDICSYWETVYVFWEKA